MNVFFLNKYSSRFGVVFFVVAGWLGGFRIWAQTTSNFRVVGYYAGTTIPVDSFETNKLTHLIFCFGGLAGNRFRIHSAADSATIQSMVNLKTKNPQLKIMLSLGGWGGCEKCSDVFSTPPEHTIEDVPTYFYQSLPVTHHGTYHHITART